MVGEDESAGQLVERFSRLAEAGAAASRLVPAGRRAAGGGNSLAGAAASGV
jgi:hypothetical protein